MVLISTDILSLSNRLCSIDDSSTKYVIFYPAVEHSASGRHRSSLQPQLSPARLPVPSGPDVSLKRLPRSTFLLLTHSVPLRPTCVLYVLVTMTPSVHSLSSSWSRRICLEIIQAGSQHGNDNGPEYFGGGANLRKPRKENSNKKRRILTMNISSSISRCRGVDGSAFSGSNPAGLRIQSPASLLPPNSTAHQLTIRYHTAGETQMIRERSTVMGNHFP